MSALHLAALAAILATLSLVAGTAEACGCGGPKPITAASRMDAVFVASVAAIDIERPPSTVGAELASA
jgi:hypothetical protein